jgi:hypothetical protein
MTRTFARLAAPVVDVAAAVGAVTPTQIPKDAALEASTVLKFDPAKVLAALEKRSRRLGRLRNEELRVDVQQDKAIPLRVAKTDVPGAYHVGVYLEGTYCPLHAHAAPAAHDQDPQATTDGPGRSGSEDDRAEHELVDAAGLPDTPAVSMATGALSPPGGIGVVKADSEPAESQTTVCSAGSLFRPVTEPPDATVADGDVTREYRTTCS